MAGIVAYFVWVIGLYIVLSRPHALWILLGLEMLLNAGAILLVAIGTAEAMALLLLLLFFALVEAAAALFLFAGWKHTTGHFSLTSLRLP
jgi:NADH:ubiquinone oxidoreductase subunit K